MSTDACGIGAHHHGDKGFHDAVAMARIGPLISSFHSLMRNTVRAQYVGTQQRSTFGVAPTTTGSVCVNGVQLCHHDCASFPNLQ